MLAVAYAMLMWYYRYGWNRIPLQPERKQHVLRGITVIIPARNEAENIAGCLEMIYRQDFPMEKLEVLLVNDFSSDDTVAQAEMFMAEHPGWPLRVLEPPGPAEKSSKKASVTYAVTQATYDIIVCTDADCRAEAGWLRAYAGIFSEKNAVFVSGPVAFYREKGFMEKGQALEFAGLVAIGAASLSQGHPNMCNGANLAYLKTVFQEVGGYRGNDHLLSGDDEFLLHKVFRKYPQRTFFIKSREALVYTNPSSSLPAFLRQRMRWVSKSTHYEDKRITGTLVFAYLVNLSLLVNLVLAFYFPEAVWIFIVQLMLKYVAEWWFFRSVLDFFRRKELLRLILPAEIFHILYVVLIGLLGNFVKYTWKGRKS